MNESTQLKVIQERRVTSSSGATWGYHEKAKGTVMSAHGRYFGACYRKQGDLTNCERTSGDASLRLPSTRIIAAVAPIFKNSSVILPELAHEGKKPVIVRMYHACPIVHADTTKRRMLIMRTDQGGVVKGRKAKVEKIPSYHAIGRQDSIVTPRRLSDSPIPPPCQ